MGNSPKELKAAIDALSKQLHALDSLVRQQGNEFHKLLRDAPWKDIEQAPPEASNADNASAGTPRQSGVIVPPLGAQNKTSNSKTAQTEPKFWKTWRFWNRLLGVIGGIAGVVYVSLTYLQWNDAARHFALDERAWLAFDMVKLAKEQQAKKLEDFTALSADIDLYNAGKSPAFSLIGVASAEVVENLKPPTFSYKGEFSYLHTIGILFQNNRITVKAGSAHPITAEQRKSLEQGQSYIAFYGATVYTDMFGKKHRTRFCTPRGFVIGASIEAKACTDYNTTDAD
jgi:hypothetical protein